MRCQRSVWMTHHCMTWSYQVITRRSDDIVSLLPKCQGTWPTKGHTNNRHLALQWVQQVSITVANLVMEDVEEWAFESYPTPPPWTVHSLTNPDAMTSALSEHAMDTMHKIAWEDAEVLASNPRPHQQCAAEAWHIWSQPLLMNREASLLPLFTMDWSTDFL